jgi:RNA polymerase sigma-32 factor
MAGNHKHVRPMLSEQEERELGRRWRDEKDTRAMGKLVEHHVALAGRIANEYRSNALLYEDLFQEALLGLTIAAHRFDPDHGPRFATYASYWIRASVLNLILRCHGPVRIGTTRAQRKLYFGLSRARRQAEQEGGTADPARIAEILGVSPEEVEGMSQRLSNIDVSLEAPRGGGDPRPWSAALEDEGPDPELLTITRETKERRKAGLARSVDSLDPRERAIIRARHLHDQPATLETLGAEFGISRERIRQLESRAIGKLSLSLKASEA